MTRPESLDRGFAEWWSRVGQSLDPDTSDVPWFDKRKALAEAAFDAAMAQSGNYVADDAVEATQVTFVNGRTVTIVDSFLRVSRT